MKYKLKVGISDSDEYTGTPTLWDRYCSTVAEQTGIDGSKWSLGRSLLYLYNAVDLNGTPYIEFDSVEDALAFVLRFS